MGTGRGARPTTDGLVQRAGAAAADCVSAVCISGWTRRVASISVVHAGNCGGVLPWRRVEIPAARAGALRHVWRQSVRADARGL